MLVDQLETEGLRLLFVNHRLTSADAAFHEEGVPQVHCAAAESTPTRDLFGCPKCGTSAVVEVD
jgi:hypothetical protein